MQKQGLNKYVINVPECLKKSIFISVKTSYILLISLVSRY
jgi:hypothetical protein